MAGKIFVNYRRDDDPNGAARVRDGLKAKFGASNVFMDVDNLIAGQRFDEELAKALSKCDILIAVMGRRWNDLLKERAATDARDYVREEIAEALARKLIVIPVRVGREGQLPALPQRDELPEDIRDLVLHQKHDVVHERFGRDISDLIAEVVAVRRTNRPQLAGARARWAWIAATGVAASAVVLFGARHAGVPMPWVAAPTSSPGSMGPGDFGAPVASEPARDRPTIRTKLDQDAPPKVPLTEVIVPEGLTSLKIVERLSADPNLTGDITLVPAEGSLFPNTYAVKLGTSRQGLVGLLQSEQQKMLDALWAERQPDLPLTSSREALILASIVEKESIRADLKGRVAAVFINRLRKGMRLMSDKTVLYGLVGGHGALDRPVTRTEIAAPTPYNTYHVDGLPAGAICNPGRSTVEATLNPASTDDLYFAADGFGGLYFTATLADHNAATEGWRRIHREQSERDKAKLPSGN